jgi:hypothetical protein
MKQLNMHIFLSSILITQPILFIYISYKIGLFWCCLLYFTIAQTNNVLLFSIVNKSRFRNFIVFPLYFYCKRHCSPLIFLKFHFITNKIIVNYKIQAHFTIKNIAQLDKLEYVVWAISESPASRYQSNLRFQRLPYKGKGRWVDQLCQLGMRN